MTSRKSMADGTRGFTLIESMLYLTVAAGVLYAVAMLDIIIVDNSARNDAKAGVDASSAQALRIMTAAIRRAESVEEPARQSIGGELVLRMQDSTADPTSFIAVDGLILMTEGAREAVAITVPDAASTVSFENLSGSDASESVRIQLDAEERDAFRTETEYASTYYASATTR